MDATSFADKIDNLLRVECTFRGVDEAPIARCPEHNEPINWRGCGACRIQRTRAKDRGSGRDRGDHLDLLRDARAVRGMKFTRDPAPDHQPDVVKVWRSLRHLADNETRHFAAFGVYPGTEWPEDGDN